MFLHDAIEKFVPKSRRKKPAAAVDCSQVVGPKQFFQAKKSRTAVTDFTQLSSSPAIHNHS